MKKLLVILAAALCVLPLSAQKMSKEEKAAAAKLAYEAALQSINEKAWVLVPEAYELKDGSLDMNSDEAVFISYERDHVLCQGSIVGGSNSQGYIADATTYDVTTDKKGNIKVNLVVSGRMWKGTYKITVRANSNSASVIYMPNNGDTKKFQGPVVPLVGATYNKRSNPL